MRIFLPNGKEEAVRLRRRLSTASKVALLAIGSSSQTMNWVAQMSFAQPEFRWIVQVRSKLP